MSAEPIDISEPFGEILRRLGLDELGLLHLEFAKGSVTAKFTLPEDRRKVGYETFKVTI